jgi:hypothetical protein
MATHGLKDEGNRHPFPVTKNKKLLRQTNLICQMAVAHNGVLSQYTEHKKYSDTQKFILDILAEEDIKNHLDNEKIRKLINSFLGGDRLAILRNDGVIFIFGEWIEEGEILYSNSGYKVPIYTYKSSYGKFSSNLEDNNRGYISNCECCGEEKFCNWMTDLTDKIQEWLLCKSCRKRYRKGKVKVEEFIVNIVDKEEDDIPDEEIIISGDTENAKHSVYCGCKSCRDTKKDGQEVKVEKECNNCNMMFPEEELFPYYTYRLCMKCINEFNYYEASLKQSSKIKDKK